MTILILNITKFLSCDFVIFKYIFGKKETEDNNDCKNIVIHKTHVVAIVDAEGNYNNDIRVIRIVRIIYIIAVEVIHDDILLPKNNGYEVTKGGISNIPFGIHYSLENKKEINDVANSKFRRTSCDGELEINKEKLDRTFMASIKKIIDIVIADGEDM